MILTFILLVQFLYFAQSRTILQNEFVEVVQVDENYVKFKSFKFYKKTRTFGALNVTFSMFMDVVDDTTKVIVTAYQFKNNEYKKSGIEFSLGICHIYKVDAFNAKSVVAHSNMTGCPFWKGDYYMHDAAPRENSLPPFFPEGKWMVEFRFVFNDITITTVHWMMNVRKAIN